LTEEQKSYRHIFKATSLFGGVQVITIIAGIIKNKFAAILLGTAGFGFIGLLNAPLAMITTFTGLGLNFSSVRFIAESNESGDNLKVSQMVYVFRRWIWFTGLLGMLLTIIFSNKLSNFAFGNLGHSLDFKILSVTILLGSIASGQKAVLQGFRRLKHLAKSTVYGSITGLIVSIPLFYFFRLKGIIPSMVLVSFFVLIFSWFFSHKIKLLPVSLGAKSTVFQGFGMVKLGLMMVLSGIIASSAGYILTAFISRRSGLEVVGFYTAGWSIVGQYVNIVFSAMGSDYYPRLASINNDNSKVTELVNQQTISSILILLPLLLLLLLTMPLVIRLFFTSAFLPVIVFVNWTIFGILFKAASWSLGYILVAKGDSRTFLVTEVIGGGFLLSSNLLGFIIGGLEGLGVSFAINYLFYLIMIYFVAKKKYAFFYQKDFLKIFLLVVLLCSVGFGLTFVKNEFLRYLSGSAVLCLGAAYSFYELNRRMNLVLLIKEKFNRR
jgi:O-antigen/teichoic acid export membrane protein